MEGILNGGRDFQADILDTTAADTPDMLVVTHIAIEPFLGSTELKFLDQAAFGENLQITVNGSQTDPR